MRMFQSSSSQSPNLRLLLRTPRNSQHLFPNQHRNPHPLSNSSHNRWLNPWLHRNPLLPLLRLSRFR